MVARDSVASTFGRVTRASVKGLSTIVDLLRPPGSGVVVLIYHQVGAPGRGAVNLSVEAFDAQMAWLSQGCVPVTLTRALELVELSYQEVETQVGDRVPVVVTFDDGTADFVNNALPVLERHGVPATLYLATRWVDEGLSFWDDGTVLSWDGVREVTSTGLVTIGSHTHSHVLLDRLAPSEIDDELDRSIDLIGTNIGVAPRHFAYPKALSPSSAADAAVRARFDSAALAGTEPNLYGATDPFRLARSPIQVADAQRWFRRKAKGGLGLEDRLRERLLARRYASAQR